jgi:hypothetical protein
MYGACAEDDALVRHEAGTRHRRRLHRFGERCRRLIQRAREPEVEDFDETVLV